MSITTSVSGYPCLRETVDSRTLVLLEADGVSVVALADQGVTPDAAGAIMDEARGELVDELGGP